jgi:hypothetical protein
MKMVISLRELGYPYADIKRARDYLFENIDIGTSINAKKGSPELTRNFIDFYSSDTITPAMKEIMEEVMNLPEVVDKISSIFASRCRRLDLIIFEAVNNKQMEVGLGFFAGGECTTFNWNLIVAFESWHPDIQQNDVLNETIRRPHIYISITRYIIDFISEAELEERNLAFALLSSMELQVLRELKNRDNKTIIISYDKHQESRIIKTEHEHNIKASEYKAFIDKILFMPYVKWESKTLKNGKLRITVTRTKKLNQ